MATVIKLKRSETASNVPTSSELEVGEVAVNTSDKAIYMKDSSNSVITVANFVVPGSDPSYLIKSNNLSDVDAATARTNLDVDSKAEVTSKATDSGIIFAIALG